MSFASTLGVVPPVALGIVAGVSFTAQTPVIEVAILLTQLVPTLLTYTV